jgi:hypothetical protein
MQYNLICEISILDRDYSMWKYIHGDHAIIMIFIREI